MTTKPQKQNYRNAISRVAGYIANISRPKFFVKTIIKLYVKFYKIDLSQFIVPENFFETFNDFFTRKIKDNLRIIQEDIVSPIDGALLDCGKVNKEQKITVKDRTYFLTDLLGTEFKNLKSYAVFYLAPGNYHRVHAGFDMNITDIKYLPGTLRPVKIKVIDKRDRVYCRNERIIITGDCKYGKFYFILVGALFVGKIKLSFDSGLSTNIRKGIASEKIFPEKIIIQKGKEVGYFEMGSSVVIVMEDECLNNLDPEKNSNLQYGRSLIF